MSDFIEETYEKKDSIFLTSQFIIPIGNLSAFIGVLYLEEKQEMRIYERSKERKLTFLERINPDFNRSDSFLSEFTLDDYDKETFG